MLCNLTSTDIIVTCWLSAKGLYTLRETPTGTFYFCFLPGSRPVKEGFFAATNSYVHPEPFTRVIRLVRRRCSFTREIVAILDIIKTGFSKLGWHFLAEDFFYNIAFFGGPMGGRSTSSRNIFLGCALLYPPPPKKRKTDFLWFWDWGYWGKSLFHDIIYLPGWWECWLIGGRVSESWKGSVMNELQVNE